MSTIDKCGSDEAMIELDRLDAEAVGGAGWRGAFYGAAVGGVVGGGLIGMAAGAVAGYMMLD